MKLMEQDQNKAETEALEQVMADEWQFMKLVEDEFAAADQVIAEDMKFRQDVEDSVAEVSEKLPGKPDNHNLMAGHDNEPAMSDVIENVSIPGSQSTYASGPQLWTLAGFLASTLTKVPFRNNLVTSLLTALATGISCGEDGPPDAIRIK